MDERCNAVAGRFGKNERDEEARVEIKYSLFVLTALVSRLAQQLGAGAPQPRHRRAERGQVIQHRRMLWMRDRMDMGHRGDHGG